MELHFQVTVAESSHKRGNLEDQADRTEKRLRKSMSCGNDCGLRRGLIQNGGLLAGKKQLEFKMKK